MKFDATELHLIEATSGQGRMDIYTDIHKALRAWMAHTLTCLGQLDASDDTSTTEVMAELAQLLDVLHGHVETEDTFVHPAIKARHPGAVDEIEQDHESHRLVIAQLRSQAQALLAVPAAQRAPAALSLYREWSLFVAENLDHMQVEETLNQQLLWSAYSDEELMQLHQAILAAQPPEKMTLVLRWMLPAITPSARAQMLLAMRATAPVEVFEGVLQLAQARLSVRDWIKLTQALNLPQVPGLVDFSQG